MGTLYPVWVLSGNVKIVGDELTVTGKLKSSDEHSVMSSEFSRMFTIPEVGLVYSCYVCYTQYGYSIPSVGSLS